MIREERDPAFWNAVACHPDVRPLIGPGVVMPDLTPVILDPHVLPMAAEHGGFIFFQRDRLGMVYELHTMFTPEAWGTREVPTAAHEAFGGLFLLGAALVFTLEVATNRRSRPPLSHGWRTACPFAFAPELAADVRTWVLTREAWDASPARRRQTCRSSLQ